MPIIKIYSYSKYICRDFLQPIAKLHVCRIQVLNSVPMMKWVHLTAAVCYVIWHSSEIRNLCLMKWSKLFQNLPIFWNTTKSQGAEHNVVLFWSVFLVNFMLSINLVFLKSVSDMAAILRITNFFHTLPLKLSRQVVVKSNYYDRYSKGEFTFSFSTREYNKKISTRELFQVRTPKKSFCSVVMVKFTWLFAVIFHNSVIVISYFLVYIGIKVEM